MLERKHKNSVVAGLACGLLSACAQTVTVAPNFPEPLIEPLPLSAGLRFTEEFIGYNYTEELPADVDWTFSLGDANEALFARVFTAMFTNLELLSDGEQIDDVDLVIEPTIVALEFSEPHQSQTDQFAVWIRYRLAVSFADGEPITDWLISAYGQSDARRFGSGKAMTNAARRAMRDAAAQISAKFAEEEKIKAALLADSAESVAEQALPEASDDS